MSTGIPVEQFISPNPITASEATSVDELWRLMDQYGVRHLPIVRDDQVTGVVSDRDVRLILGLSAAEKLQVQAVDIMSPDPIEVPADTPLDDVAFLMADRKVGSVLVTDEAGRLIGIFTITDALNALVDFVRKGCQGAR